MLHGALDVTQQTTGKLSIITPTQKPQQAVHQMKKNEKKNYGNFFWQPVNSSNY